MKKHLVSLAAVFLMLGMAATASAQRGWIFLGEAHVDGAADHDNIRVTRADGRFRAVQLRVNGGAVEFDHIVIHYGNGSSEVVPVREHVRSHSATRAIDLPGDRRVIQSVELWYHKNNLEKRPTVTLFGIR